jgi:hypothetical protein
MPGAQTTVIGLLVAAFVVFGSGFALSRVGRPYGAALLNLHKLVDLAAVVVIGVIAYQANRAAPFSAIEWWVIGLATVGVIVLFASGGIVSASEVAPGWLVRVHKVVPWFALALAAASVYVVAGG